MSEHSDTMDAIALLRADLADLRKYIEGLMEWPSIPQQNATALDEAPDGSAIVPIPVETLTLVQLRELKGCMVTLMGTTTPARETLAKDFKENGGVCAGKVTDTGIRYGLGGAHPCVTILPVGRSDDQEMTFTGTKGHKYRWEIVTDWTK